MAVAGFIFLSGYLTKMDINSKNVRKRFFTVLIPYVIFTVFYTVLSKYKLGVVGAGGAVIKNLITTQGKMTLYYLAVYMQLALLTPLLVKIARQKNNMLNGIIIIIQPLFMLCFYLGVINGDIIKEAPWYTMFFPMWILYYYLGILIGNNLIKIKLSSKVLVIAAIVSVALQITEGLFWFNTTPVKDMYYSQVRFTALLENIPILLLITKYIRRSSDKANKLLCKIGDASFGIYLLHPALIMVCDKLFARTDATFLVAFIITFLGSFAIVLVLNKLLPRKVLKYCGLALAE